MTEISVDQYIGKYLYNRTGKNVGRIISVETYLKKLPRNLPEKTKRIHLACIDKARQVE